MEQTANTYPYQETRRKENLGQTREIVVFVGPEGSGKTSQAKLLAQQIDLPFLTYGDIFREAAENDRTFLGDECRRIFEEHDYIKLFVLTELISIELRKKEYQNGAVIDGALRIPGEVESFEELLKLAGIEKSNITVFYLRIPGWKGFERTLNGRKRPDDTVEGMTGRLSAFYSGLGQRSSELRKMSEGGRLRFIQINANRTIEEISGEILEKFKQEDLE